MTGVAAADDTTPRGETPSGEREDEPRWEQYRVELTGYCYRMLGSAADAEDAVQDTLVRAWRSYDKFEGRSAVRSWLYRIATNVCLTMLDGRNRRARPMDFGPASSASDPLGPKLPESTWLTPIPDAMVLPSGSDPADLAVSRESVRLAFVAALQHLPARQRAVLILREVLQWKAAEVAELLETSVASVNSALQRARATLAENNETPAEPVDELDDEHRQLLDRYAAAFERYDIAELVTLLHDDAVLSMPPYELWLRGTEDIVGWWVGPGCHCKGSKLIPLLANGLPAFAQYRPDLEGDGYHGWALQVLEFSGGKITFFNSFLDTEALFPLFGLPQRLDADGKPVEQR
ncbi:MAG TPA: sigma-70 family RNA polymerase sigma factor [Pseudonocardia sp.]|jgi:RNA polymerase sigma-70 factor (ECF subfamily)|nr:sigma-70 family RNA polymerase sigma factor [Pseudonocardia sp.]